MLFSAKIQCDIFDDFQTLCVVGGQLGCQPATRGHYCNFSVKNDDKVENFPQDFRS